jgi:hypothetical protein
MDKSQNEINRVPDASDLNVRFSETPHTEFDKTSLKEAHDQGLIKAPYSAETTPNTPKKPHVLRNIGIFAAGAAIAGGAVFGITSINSAPKSQPVATAPGEPVPDISPSVEASEPTATESESPVSGGELLSVEALEIPAGLDAEKLGTMIVADRFTSWANAGAYDGLLMQSVDENLSWDEMLPEIADKNMAVYADALYVDGWEQKTQLTQFVEGTRDSNLGTLQWYTSTQWSSEEKPENKEGYKQWLTVDGVQEVSTDSNERTIDVAVTSHSNSDMNLGPAPLKEKAIYTITLEEVDGTEKIADISLR